MERKNRFYLFKELSTNLIANSSFDLINGELVSGNDSTTVKIEANKADKLGINFSDIQHTSKLCLQWDENDNYIGYSTVLYTTNNYTEFNLSPRTQYLAVLFVNASTSKAITLQTGFEIIPHYKQLKKKYAKESGQAFFRESLEGKIKLFNTDYELVKNASLEDNIIFRAYRVYDNKQIVSASFNKSDCKFDHAKKNVELKLTYNDLYTEVLNAYEKTYDIIKLAPALSPLTLTKRCVVQIYIQGENVISSYAGGTYWETEVDERIDDEDMLLRKYYFSKGPKYIEVSLQDFNYNINAAYEGAPSSNIWNAICKRVVNGQKYEFPCSIKFNKVASAGEPASNIPTRLLSTGDGDGLQESAFVSDNPSYVYRYDTYQIEIWDNRDGTGTKLYQSDYYYGKDSDFVLAVGDGLYPMTALNLPVPMSSPTPNKFNLGENVIEYQIWGRLLCDVDYLEQEAGQAPIATYDLPRDDFATPRHNYRKCIGLTGFDGQNSYVKIFQSNAAIEEPTSYGMNDYGEYFVPPYTLFHQYFYPLARNTWGNTSLWVALNSDENIQALDFEFNLSKTYKEYTLRNSYHIGDVIKAILKKIDPQIKHEKTSDYSMFLYGHEGASAQALGNCNLYITQKTNILKGEYDQAAQKAEIQLKQIMEMLRDCFRCYWFIDENNRFRIEHISYFANGMTYGNADVQLDLTVEFDKFNRKEILYCQQEVEYNKSDLISRYEFSWVDDTTKAMGGDLYIDISNKYIPQDKVEQINVDNFTSDIDYMLFLPEDFSNDGFALLLADNTGKVPIVHQRIKDEKQFDYYYDVYVQNWYASFNQLIHHYMYDLSGNNISYNNVEDLLVNSVNRCMKHKIDFPLGDNADIDIYKALTTEIGTGYIEEVLINIDTNLTEVELRYEPS